MVAFSPSGIRLRLSGSTFNNFPNTFTELAATGAVPLLTGVGPKKIQKAGMLGQ